MKAVIWEKLLLKKRRKLTKKMFNAVQKRGSGVVAFSPRQYT